MTNFNFPKEYMTNIINSGYNVIGANIKTPVDESYVVFSNGKDLRIVKNKQLRSDKAREIAKNMSFPNNQAISKEQIQDNKLKLAKIKLLINEQNKSLDKGREN